MISNFWNQCVGFWRTVKHLFAYIGDIVTDTNEFIPTYVQMALWFFLSVAMFVLVIKVLSGIFKILTIGASSLIKFFIPTP